MLTAALLAASILAPQDDATLARRLELAWTARRVSARCNVVPADDLCPYCRIALRKVTFDDQLRSTGKDRIDALLCTTDRIAFLRRDEPWHHFEAGPILLPGSDDEARRGMRPFGLRGVEARRTSQPDWCFRLYSPDRNYCFGWDVDGITRIWSTRELMRFDWQMGTTAFAWAPGGQMVAAACSGGDIFAWRLPSVKRVHIKPTTFRNITSLAFDRNAKRLAISWIDAGGDDPGAHVELLRMPDGKRLARWDADDVGDGMSRFTWSADNQQLALADTRGRLLVWDVATHRRVLKHEAREFVRDLSWSGDGRRIALALGREGYLAEIVTVTDGNKVRFRAAPAAVGARGRTQPAIALDDRGERLAWLLPDGYIVVGTITSPASGDAAKARPTVGDWRFHYATEDHAEIGWATDSGFWSIGIGDERLLWDPALMLPTDRVRSE